MYCPLTDAFDRGWDAKVSTLHAGGELPFELYDSSAESCASASLFPAWPCRKNW